MKYKKIGILVGLLIFMSTATSMDVCSANLIGSSDAVIGEKDGQRLLPRSISKYFRTRPSRYQASVPTLPATSEGIQTTYEKLDPKSPRHIDTITYTIPKGYRGDIVINATEDIFRTIGGIYQPGDQVPLTIKVENLSGNTYGYKTNSFQIATENFSAYTLEAASEFYGFDGSPILLCHTTKRTGNTAIQALYHLNSAAEITQEQVCDTALAPLLIQAGYENGSQDLGSYYLDFYNRKYDMSVKRLEDFPDEVVYEMFDGKNLREVETSPEVAELGYNWFYNRLLSAVPEGREYSDENTDYTIGNYMRGSGLYETYCEKAFGRITEGTYSLKKLTLHFNKNYTAPAYRDINLNLCIGFELEQL